jgi:hypothetical protein
MIQKPDVRQTIDAKLQPADTRFHGVTPSLLNLKSLPSPQETLHGHWKPPDLMAQALGRTR